MSNHNDREYIIQWYGANGTMRAAAPARINIAVGRAGIDLTRERDFGRDVEL